MNINKKVLTNILPQGFVLTFLILLIGFFAFNASVNMGNRGIAFGFHFLSQEASFDITFSLIDYDGSYSYGRAYLVGLLNTLLVSVTGIIFATILGVIIGVARLSDNVLVSKLASVYIETWRNIPLILQLFFWYFAVLRTLPLPENAIPIFDTLFLTIKGLHTPKFIWENFGTFFSAIIIALVISYMFFKYAKKEQEISGKQLPRFWVATGLILILPYLTLLTGIVDLNFEHPELIKLSDTVSTYKGGVTIIPEFLSLLFALALYTSTFIAENVRAGIMGINKGQREASASLGLTKGQALRLVIMPQALRIIIPPTTNQYLNLTKNSSLAAAIAYPDIVLVFAGTALMQTGRAIEIVSITMFTYLTLSISISILMNWYNKKIALVEK